MNNTLASAPHQAVRPGAAKMSCRRLPTLRSIIGAWRERIRVRWQLRQMVKDNPHLIDDIGLTERQVEAEIAKRFWQR